MATRIFALAPGGQQTDVQENVGPTATSAIVAVVIDLATGVTGVAGARTVNYKEVLNALENIKAYIMSNNKWPPA